MMRGLYLTVCAFLCCAVIASGLKCHYCEREFPGTGCNYPQDICYTHRKGYCISIIVSKRDTVLYRMEGCAKRLMSCMKDKVYRTGVKTDIFCCQYDLCNHWKRDTV